MKKLGYTLSVFLFSFLLLPSLSFAQDAEDMPMAETISAEMPEAMPSMDMDKMEGMKEKMEGMDCMKNHSYKKGDFYGKSYFHQNKWEGKSIWAIIAFKLTFGVFFLFMLFASAFAIRKGWTVGGCCKKK